MTGQDAHAGHDATGKRGDARGHHALGKRHDARGHDADNRDPAKGLFFAAAGFAAWGLLSPGNEILLRQYTPMWMQAVRSVLAAAIVMAWLGPSSLARAVQVLRERRVLTALFFGTFASFALFSLAQTRIPATFTTLGFYTSPLWTALLARFMLGERVGISFIPATLALFAGGWLALTGGGALPLPDAVGVALAVGSGLAWGAYAVLLRRHGGHVAWRDLLLASLVMASPLFIAAALIFEPLPAVTAFTTETWTWTVIQAVIPTIVSLALFQAALRMAPAGQVNILVGVELAATVFFAWLLLDATFTVLQLAGIAAVLAAISLYLWHRTRPRGTPRGGPI